MSDQQHARGFWRGVFAVVVWGLAAAVTARHQHAPRPDRIGETGTTYPRVYCFDPDSPPPEAERALLDLQMRGGGAEYNQESRWSGTIGTPRTLYWSLVPDGTMLPGRDGQAAAPSNLFAQMDAKFGGNRALWISQFQAAVDRWSYLTGVNYVRITSGGNDWDDGAAFPDSIFNGTSRGDVRIGGRALDGGGGVLAFNYYPTVGDMVIDTQENWGSSSASYRFLRNVVMHELGHGLGMQHVCPSNSTKLMEPFYSGAYDGPQHDDIRGVQSFYGDVYEPNGTLATTTLLPALTPGATINPSAITVGASVTNGRLTGIDNDGDIDWFRFPIAQPLVANVVLTPVGLSYDSSVQTPGGGACESGSIIDSFGAANLALEVRIGSGGVIVFAQNAGGPGANESINSVLLSPASDMYIKVYETDAPTMSQAYNLAISAISVPSMAATDATQPGLVRVTWSSLPGAAAFAVYRSTSSARTGALQVGTASGAATQFDDASADPGTPYWYWVDAQQGGGGLRAFAGPDAGSAAPPVCDDIDFNNDGLFPDTADFDDLLSVFSGGECSLPACGDIDFNNDGLFPDTADIDSYLSVFSGGPCL